jgi:hypothetical protein
MIDVNELRVGNRVILLNDINPRLILDKWKEGNEVMISLTGSGGITSETINAKQISRVIVNDVVPDAVAAQ